MLTWRWGVSNQLTAACATTYPAILILQLCWRAFCLSLFNHYNLVCSIITKLFLLGRHELFLLQPGVWIYSDALWRLQDRRKKITICLYLPNHDSLSCLNNILILLFLFYLLIYHRRICLRKEGRGREVYLTYMILYQLCKAQGELWGGGRGGQEGFT
jgi:hypothetical protein